MDMVSTLTTAVDLIYTAKVITDGMRGEIVSFFDGTGKRVIPANLNLTNSRVITEESAILTNSIENTQLQV